MKKPSAADRTPRTRNTTTRSVARRAIGRKDKAFGERLEILADDPPLEGNESRDDVSADEFSFENSMQPRAYGNPPDIVEMARLMIEKFPVRPTDVKTALLKHRNACILDTGIGIGFFESYDFRDLFSSVVTNVRHRLVSTLR